MDWNDFDAVLFDLDGVITPTADVHMAAWAEMFNAYLASRGDERPYTDDDYFAFVDGKPRYDGVRSFLGSRGITLPEGSPSDPPDAETVCGLGNRKNVVFNTIVDRDGVTPYPGSVALLDSLSTRPITLAVVSSSQNAQSVLRAAGLIDRFAVIVDGNVAREQSLPGKPAPDTFTYAADAVRVPSTRAVVVEDAISGVAAGAAGGFGLVVGVDRGVGADALRQAGAQIVVDDLADLVPEDTP